METKEIKLNKIFEAFDEGYPAKALVYALELELEYPQDVEILNLIAGIYDAKNDIINTIEYYMKALKLKTDNNIANFKIAEMLYLLQNKNKDLYNKYLEKWQNLAGKELITEISIKSLKKEENEYNSEYVKTLFNYFAGCFDNVLGGLLYQTPYKIAQAVEKLAKKQMQIIDFGCGTGLCGELIRKHASYLIGLDISEEMLEKAKQKSIYDELFCEDLLKFTSKKQYDIGISGDVFTYFNDISVPLAKFKELIKDGGYMLISFSYPRKWTFKNVIQETAGRHFHRKSFIKKEIKKQGLKIIFVKDYNLRKELNSFTKGGLFLIKKPS